MDTFNRAGENGATPFRTDRFFSVSDKWYFSTREGFDSGPYASKLRAEEGLKRFLKVAQLVPHEDSHKVTRIHRIY
ncbi:hypothetical protein BTA51_21210 [Hahella sp. CCB-MM4]|uniref:DUF6316 family protein n=1 Tax=Hahella sp. (strain CCB-MM4) TaxID=1926491 RepID=UPI000B9C15FD|nr:DUF6316 family protein [Hahella sp. CCB-MM4]OZG71456.1 hypothetical protein BTA51_21210 [Hahella sp. CCB-MM4]